MKWFINCLRLLLEKKINTVSELKDAVQELHKLGPQTVAVSSTDIDEKLTSVVSTAKGKVNFKWKLSSYQ